MRRRPVDMNEEKRRLFDELRAAKEEAEEERRRILARLGTKLAGRGGARRRRT